jgi:acyl-CoA thioesterase FadM
LVACHHSANAGKISIETYIEKIERQKCFRVVEFYKLPERILAAKAILIWVALDILNKRPIRVEQNVIDCFMDT